MVRHEVMSSQRWIRQWMCEMSRPDHPPRTWQRLRLLRLITSWTKQLVGKPWSNWDLWYSMKKVEVELKGYQLLILKFCSSHLGASCKKIPEQRWMLIDDDPSRKDSLTWRLEDEETQTRLLINGYSRRHLWWSRWTTCVFFAELYKTLFSPFSGGLNFVDGWKQVQPL